MSAKFEEVELWKRTKLMEILNEYDEKTYTMPMNHTFLQFIAGENLCKKRHPSNGYKKIYSEFQYFFYCNSIRTNKLISLVIGHFKKPRCLKSVKCLPVNYDGNRNTWMTREIF